MNKYCVAVAAACLLGSIPAIAAQEKGSHATTMFEEMDTNSDGVISKDEFMASAGKRFDKIDANHDGKITHEEVDAYHKEQMEKFNKMRQEMKSQDSSSKAPATNMMPAPTAPSKSAPATMAPPAAAPK